MISGIQEDGYLRITPTWSVAEEIGLVGATTLAENYREGTIVYPVD